VNGLALSLRPAADAFIHPFDGARRVCEQAFACSQTHPVRGVVVSDGAALSACERFLANHRLLVEPACGASLVLADDRSPALAGHSCVLFVVRGGATADLARIRACSRRLRRSGGEQRQLAGTTDKP